MAGPGILDVLAQYCDGLRYEDLPAEVVETAKVKLLDAIALAVASAGTETRDVLARYLVADGDTGSCSLFGLPGNYSVKEAAFANAVLAHAILQDDADPESGHPDCMVTPAAYASTQYVNADGRALLTAIVVGFEMMWRGGAGHLVLNGASKRGIRGYTLNGSIGAAAAAGKALGLDKGQLAAALSCAATFASGLLEPIENGHMERSLMPGANARSGVLAALLARNGMRGTPTNLEGSNGYWRAMADIDAATVTAAADLDKTFRISEAATKLYPSGIANQAAIFAAKEASDNAAIDVGQITAIRIRQFPLFGDGLPAYPSVISQGPYSELEEVLPNKPFSVATMLLHKRYDIHAIRERLTDSAVLELARKVTSKGVAGIAPLQCEMDIDLADGRTLEIRVDAAGDPRFFPDLDGMRTRAHELDDALIGGELVDQLADAAVGVDETGGLDHLTGVLARIAAAWGEG